MRILHTADWHLGQLLHGVPRTYEHERFLAWLLDRLEDQAVDALIVAGDIFDVASPSSAALAQYYDFLAKLRRRCPSLDVVIVAGNHDSPARIDAPADVLGSLGINVVGGVNPKRQVVPIHDANGAVGGYVIAVPFLRPRDLPTVEDADSGGANPAHGRLIAGYQKLYADLTRSVEALASPDQPIIATGHCYMAHGIVSELSERKIQVGHQHALPVDVFPSSLSYVALGHLHRAQSVGERANVRYSGSPIPLSMIERGYEHQVLLVDFDGRRMAKIDPLFVPRTVPIVCVPEEHAPLEEVLAKLRALPREAPEGADDRARPFLEVRVLRDRANPRLRRDVDEALEGAWVRLLRIDAPRTTPDPVDGTIVSKKLDTISPSDVFLAAYQRKRGEPPSEELRQMFSELVESVERGEIP